VRTRKKGDTGYPITATLKAAGTPVNLTGGSVTITMVNRISRAVKVNAAACTITDAPNGAVSYQPLSTDVDTPGVYDVEFRATLAGLVSHYPSEGFEPLTIQDNLA